MRLVSVNVARPRQLFRADPPAGKPESTGIFKVPQDGPVFVGPLGLEGDFVGDAAHHGGPDQAVYLYSNDDYAWWGERLGEVLSPGTFGENLTLDTFGPGEVRVGDRFEVGGVVLEVTGARIPCGTLAARMGDLGFVKKFREARRPGLYTRVLREGEVRAGDGVVRAKTPEPFVTVAEEFEWFFQKEPSEAQLRRLLEAPIAARSRAHYEELLAARA